MTEPTLDAPQLAVIGMAARFPGARNLAEFWANLAGGVESITQLPGAAGGYQPAGGILREADCFDAHFFDYAPRDGLIIDPQQRLFLECSWEALEHAGYDPTRYPGLVGVYAGSTNTDYLTTLRERRSEIGMVSDFQLRLATGTDFLTTRVAYKLGLRGPAVTVQTACSTSLVAIHVAAQALLAGECDLALAGGVTAHVPFFVGEYTDDGILAADGHCRAFDARAAGTIGADGVGVVVLKRLEDALADGDTVHAVLRGTAVNNDGFDKIGYTAPSVTGQAANVRTALSVADVDPGSLSYVEAHGTGTPLGDPIEIAALAQALKMSGEHSCLIGSVKTNIGHTDAAAGVAGFIKTVLALEHRQIPPSLNFTEPNPDIDFAAAGFEVNTRLCDWETGGGPRRAGVNSLGLGGTNAFAVLEEATRQPPADPGRRWQLVPLSARTPSALAATRADLADHLDQQPHTDIADLAWTLQMGRRQHEYRQCAVVTDSMFGDDITEDTPANPERTVVFVFPGQGGQHVGMAQESYRNEPVFRAAMDGCARLFAEHLGFDLTELLYGDGELASRLPAMSVAQACVFSVEYALAALWRSWGVEPDAVVGHSLGAYAAACVAGVFTLPDAVTLVAERSRLLQDLPAGAMVAVSLPEAELAGQLSERLSIAVVNGPGQCVVTGPVGEIEAFERGLADAGVWARRLRVSAAAHSVLVDAVIDRFRAVVAGLSLTPPAIPVVSDRTGEWLRDEEAVDAGYWAGHLRDTVRFSAAATTMLDDPGRIVLEVGPGQTLTALVRQHPAFLPGHRAVASLPHPAAGGSDLAHLLGAAGRLWVAGRDLDWPSLHHGRPRRRIPLPTYPFERLRFRIDAGPVTIEPVDGTVSTGAEFVAPETATEKAVATAFQEILGVATVSVRNNFFELGGDSLIATQLAGWIRAEFGVPMSVRDIFRAKTVASLSQLIDERHG